MACRVDRNRRATFGHTTVQGSTPRDPPLRVNHGVGRALASGDEHEAQANARELFQAVHRFARTR
jgi:hypothetical protein